MEIEEKTMARILEEKLREERERENLSNMKCEISNGIADFATKELFIKYQRLCELEIKTLRTEISLLRAKSSMDALQIDNLQRQYDKLLNSHRDLQEAAATSIIKSGGISGYNLTNAEFHSRNTSACRVIFGFNSFSEMKTRLACMFTEFRGPLGITPGKKGRFREGEGDWGQMFPERKLQQSPRRDPVTRNWENCLITIMRFHRNVTIEYLSLIWKLSPSTISKAIKEWAPKLGQKGLELSILDILPGFFEYALPQKFKDVNLDKVGYLVDGKVFMTEECRKHSNIKKLCWNSKVNGAGVIILDFTMACGLGIYHSPCMCGRCTEPALVKMCCDQPRTINFRGVPVEESGTEHFNIMKEPQHEKYELEK